MREAEECYRLGTSRYPDISWEWADFLCTFRALGEGHGTSDDEFLRLACLEHRPGALSALEREHIAPLRPVVRRICITDHATDEALADLRHKLLMPPNPRLALFRPTSSLRAWLSVVATRTALDVARRLGTQARREVELEEQLATMSAPDDALAHEQQRAVLREALRAAVQRLPREQRYALRMHVTAGWNITQIGRVLSVHRATVARWLLAAKDDLRVMLREELARRAAPLDDAATPLAHLPSRLDLSLSRVFATTGVLQGASAP